MFAGGTTFTATGCGTPTSLIGGGLAGSFLAQSGTCTAVRQPITLHGDIFGDSIGGRPNCISVHRVLKKGTPLDRTKAAASTAVLMGVDTPPMSPRHRDSRNILNAPASGAKIETP
jgi:hypothetical protein